MKRIVLLSAALLLAACGSDSTGPNNVTSVSGRWSFTATNLAGGGVTCSIFGVTMQLSQTGSTFTGHTVANSSGTFGTFTCSGGGQTINEDIEGQDQIAAGTIQGNVVTFDIGTSDLHSTGTVSGSSISGQTVLKLSDGTVTGNLVGNFSMVKQ